MPRGAGLARPNIEAAPADASVDGAARSRNDNDMVPVDTSDVVVLGDAADHDAVNCESASSGSCVCDVYGESDGELEKLLRLDPYRRVLIGVAAPMRGMASRGMLDFNAGERERREEEGDRWERRSAQREERASREGADEEEASPE